MPRDPAPPEDDAREKALEALSLMRREGLSMTRAARTAGITRKTMKRHVGSAMKRTSSGAWKAKKWDRLPRQMLFPTEKGAAELTIRDSRSASVLGNYWVAVDEFLESGDETVLHLFRSNVITSDRIPRRLVTEPRLLKRLAAAGEVAFEDIYARTQ